MEKNSSKTVAHTNRRGKSGPAPSGRSYWEISVGNFIFILLCLKFIHQLHHRAPEKHIQMKDNLQLGKEEEAGEEEELPWAQKLHHNVVFMSARVEEPQVPAGDDAVQTPKDTLHQPGEDRMQLLQGTRAASHTDKPPVSPETSSHREKQTVFMKASEEKQGLHKYTASIYLEKITFMLVCQHFTKI